MTFNPELATPRDRVRLQVGDTSGDPATEFMPDETYDAIIAYNGNDEVRATIHVASSLIAKYSQQASRINLGDLEISWRDRLTAWKSITSSNNPLVISTQGGGFSIMRPSREESRPEYRRPGYPGEDEPWFNEPR